MKKRILALMLACFMIVSLLPAQVFAAGTVKCPNTHSVDNCEYTEITTVAPLCEVWGYTVCQCNDCGEYFVNVNVAPLGDHVLEDVAAKAPSCAGEKGEEGVKAHKKCSVCGWLFVVENGKLVRVDAEDLVIPALQHTFYVDSIGGCEGTVRNCLVCGYSEPVDGTHNWSLIPEILKDPDEIKFIDGLARYTCEDCGATKEVVIRHHECVDHIVTVPKTEPTCTEPGWKMEHEYCPICDRRYVDVLGTLQLKPESFFVWKPLGHTPGTAPVPQEDEVDVNLHYTYNPGGALYAPGSPYFWIVPMDCTFTGAAWADVKSEGVILVYNAANELVEAGTALTAGDILYFQVTEDGERTIVISYEVDPELLQIGTCLDPKRERTYVCARCEEVITEELQGGHKWSKTAVLEQKPTCDADGFVVVECELCGLKKVNVTPALGHNYVAGKAVAGTCVTKGYTPYTCTNCGDSYKVEGDYGKHNEIVISINEPDCVTAGNKLCYCTLCRAYYNVPLEALGHPNSYTKVETSCGYYAVDPTKTVLGIITTTTFYCYDCAADQANYEPVVTVTFKEADYDYIYESVKAAQADHCQSVTYTYSAKFDTKTYGAKQKDTKAVHELVFTRNLIPATCLEKGLDEYLCTGCGMYIMIEVAALGHHYEDGEHTVQPTCTEPGYSLGGWCSRCGYVPYEILPATGHKIDTKKNVYEDVEPTCTTSGSYKGGYCENCKNWIRFYTVEVEVNGVKTQVEMSEVVANEQALIRPALGHAETIVDSYFEAYYTEMDPGFLYVHYECRREGCDEEYIYWFHRHEWVHDVKGSKTPDDCSKVKNPTEGYNHYFCAGCGMDRYEIVPVHTYGAESCENYGKVCENCAHVCAVSHEFYLEATEEASCVSGAYNLFVCAHCEASYAVSLSGPDANKHVWGDPVAIEGTDMAYYGCTLCGEIKIDHLYPEHVIFDLELVNPKDLIYVGKQIAVNVVISGNTADVWGFDVDVLFDDDYLAFDRVVFGTNFNGYAKDNYYPVEVDEKGNVLDMMGYVSIAGNADGSTVITEEVVATIYFDVIDYGYLFLDMYINTVTDPDMNEFGHIYGETYGQVLAYAFQIMDYYMDGVVDLLDVQAVYNYIAGAEGFEYSILGDTDADGDIDLVDLEAIYKAIVS